MEDKWLEKRRDDAKGEDIEGKRKERGRGWTAMLQNVLVVVSAAQEPSVNIYCHMVDKSGNTLTIFSVL